jgi:paraquat-inducible protein B
METIIKNSLKKIDKNTSLIEKEYIEDNLCFFIDKEKKITRENVRDEWYIHEDRETLMRYLLMDYILKHFNLNELYIIFFRQDFYKLTRGIICEGRRVAIENINDDDSFTPTEKKRLKRKVWDMNPLLFGLVLEFIHISEIFWDNEKEDYVFPEFCKVGL